MRSLTTIDKGLTCLLTNLTTTGKLIEPSPPSPSPFGSIRRAAHARSIANLGSLFNAPTSSLSSVPSGSLNALSIDTPANLFGPPLGQLAPPLG